MQVTVNDLGAFKRSLQLEIPLEEMKPTYDSVYRQLRKTKLNGFRPGKFPKGWLDKRFTEYMQVQATEEVIPKYFDQAMREQAIMPASNVSIKEVEFERKAPLKAVLEFEIRPELALPDYTKLQVETQEVEPVTEAEVEAEIQNLLKSQATRTPKEDDAVAEQGDIATLTFEGKLTTGELLPNAQGEDVLAEIGGETFPEFAEHLPGMKAGETKEVTLTLPESYGDHAGAEAQFSLTVNRLESATLPELTDEFCLQFGATTVEELKKLAEDRLINSRTASVRATYRNQVDEQLQTLYGDFELPESPMEQARQQATQRAEQDGVPDQVETRLAEELKEVRRRYILDAIALQEQVQVNTYAAMEEFWSFSQMFGTDPEQFIKTDYGRRFYEMIQSRKFQEAVLDRVVARVLGEPLEESPAPEHTHD